MDADKLRQAKLELVTRQSPLALVAAAINSLVYAGFSWKFLPHQFLLIWIFANFFLIATRLFFHLKGNLSLKKLTVLVALSAAAWGSIGGMLSTSFPIPIQLLTFFLLAGMTAGAVGAYSAHFFLTSVYIVPALLPLIVRLSLTGSWAYFAMGLVTLLYGLLMLRMSYNISNQNHQFLRLNRELDLAEAASKAKSIFLANASHEIRTPLTAISGFSELLLHRTDVSDDIHEDLETIFRNSQYLLGLVDQLLDLSKVESWQLNLNKSWFSPMQELNEITSLVQKALTEKNLHLEISYDSQTPEMIYSDPIRFRQVVINLISNSIKFTDRGEISVRVDLKNPKLLRVTVRDTGIGMSPETLRTLFQPFARGKAALAVPGSGLGLALSQKLAHLMGGDLRVVFSEPGKGSVLEFNLDPGEVSMAPKNVVVHHALRGPLPLKGMYILVAEDSVDLQKLLSHNLAASGALVDVCNNGAEAVEQAQKFPYSLVLMDMKMPILDGYEAVRQIRSLGYDRPILALTANASLEDRQRCLKCGCTEYLAKPIMQDHLVKSILKFAPN